MNTSDTKAGPGAGVRFGDRDALHEMLIASLTLALQIGDADTGDCVMDAIRTLHRDEAIDEDPGDVGFV